MKKQLSSSKRGEINFRKKLIQQQVDGKSIFKDEFDAKGIEKILVERMTKTLEQMTKLKQRGYNLSLYLEIGAERCQRSLVMENDINSTGVAIDISYHALKSGSFYSKLFNKNKIPLRICCDANKIPIMSNSIPFVFCYETLHHFPNPLPIITEIHRVLAPGGLFFFDEEPYKRLFHFPLYKGKKIYSKEYSELNKLKSFLDYYFSERSCNEIEHNIVENENIPISIWRKGLRIFEEVEIYLDTLIKLPNSVKIVRTELYNSKNYLKLFLAFLFGGTISGICRKLGPVKKIEPKISLYTVLICPSCIENGYESKLDQENLSFSCKYCGNKYPIIDDILFLFSYKKFKDLYPELFTSNLLI